MTGLELFPQLNARKNEALASEKNGCFVNVGFDEKPDKGYNSSFEQQGDEEEEDDERVAETPTRAISISSERDDINPPHSNHVAVTMHPEPGGLTRAVKSLANVFLSGRIEVFLEVSSALLPIRFN